MRQQLSPQYSAGQTIPVPAGNAAAFVFSNPCQHASNDWRPPSIAPDSAAGAAHTFHGQCIPPQRPAIVHAATGASVSWERLRADVLKVARSLRAIVGGEVPFDGPQSTAPVRVILGGSEALRVLSTLERAHSEFCCLIRSSRQGLPSFYAYQIAQHLRVPC